MKPGSLVPGKNTVGIVSSHEQLRCPASGWRFASYQSSQADPYARRQVRPGKEAKEEHQAKGSED